MQTTSEGNNPNKPHMHYDISMSKRTRKPLNVKRDANQVTPEGEGPPESVKGSGDDDQDDNGGGGDSGSSGGDERKSLKLKQLIKGRRNSLGQHFTEEEKQRLQVVVKQQEEELDGVKFRKMVSRCAKLLTHLIKIKRPDPRLPSRKKPILRLGM